MKTIQKSINTRSGQAVLLVLLGMAAVLTLVLSVVSRTVVDISSTARDEDSSRAFSAAEKGIESLLIGTGTTAYVGSIGSAQFEASSTLYAQGATTAVFPSIRSGESDTIWFVSHDENGNLTCTDGPCFDGNSIEVCWNEGTETPAVEVSVYYDHLESLTTGTLNYSNIKVARYAYDPNPNRDNNFTDAASCTRNNSYEHSSEAIGEGIDLNITGCEEGCLLFARVKMLYNTNEKQPLWITTDAPLPSQGKVITSTGMIGDATRKIETVQYYAEPLGIFDFGFASFGGQGSTKN